MSDKPTDQIGKRFKTITADLKLYIEKRVELLLLNIGEQYSRWIAESIQRLTGIFLVFGAVVFLLVALAIYIGDLLGSQSLGYILVSVPLLVAGIFLFNLKPKSMVANLQQHFEAELIEALTPNGKSDNEMLNLPESSEEKIS